jgi:hypothetical protein
VNAAAAAATVVLCEVWGGAVTVEVEVEVEVRLLQLYPGDTQYTSLVPS